MSREPDPNLFMRTPVVVCELAGGSSLCFPVADPSLITRGRERQALSELRLFLEEHLAEQPAEVLATFAAAPGTEMRQLEVKVERADLPERLQLTTPVAFAAVVIRHGRDHWVVIPALDHTFHVASGEELEPAVDAEVRRMVLALEPTPQEFVELLPALDHRLELLELDVDRSAQLVSGTARALRRKVMERKRQADALEVLESVATPLHGREDVVRGPPLVGRSRELELLDGLLGGKQRLGVMLVGAGLSGKTALFHGWVRKCSPAGRAGGRKKTHEQREPRPVFSLSGARLIAGMSGLGQWQERVRRVMQAAERLDAVLYFDNLGDLFGDRPEGKVDLAGAMRPFLEEGRVRLVGEARPEALDLYESRHVGFISALHRLKLEPMEAAGAVEVLASRAAHAGKREPHRPTLDPAAVRPLVELVDRYQPYQTFPGKAVRLFEELRAVHEHRSPREEDWEEGEADLIGEQEVLETFALQSGIPLFLLRQDRALKLEQVLAKLGARLVGQEPAVQRVAETICMVKANLQPAGKPLATFLFVGPTGVGKTELARSLAVFLFNDEQRLLRFDMSEFMDAGAAQRLIQGTDRAEGQLTRRVRQQPFSVLLLDEIEKAHPAVFDLLLQVCGEGRLTDAAGRTAHFNNTTIIMTSNLGAAGRRAPIGIAPPPDRARKGAQERSDQGPDDAYYQEQVVRAFRPEFVNRIDRVIAFRALTPEEVERVARLTLARIDRRRGFEELGLTLEVTTPAALELARGGYSERYGARELRRHLEQQIVSPAACMLAELGGRAQGGTLRVCLGAEEETDDAVRDLARLDLGPLALRMLPGRTARQRAGGVSSLSAVSALRRQLDRCMALETVSEVKDQIDSIIAQLSSSEERPEGGRGQGGERDPRRARERVELSTELHRLRELWRRAQILREDMETAEELALSALLEEEDPSPYLADSAKTWDSFLEALYYLLIARRQRRDRVTLLVQELDDGRAMDWWLRPLLERGLERLGWSVLVHADGGKRAGGDPQQGDELWPSERRWSPPRPAAWALEQLERPERPFRSLVVRASGPYACIGLTLEGGVHKYEGLRGGDPVMLAVDVLARRTVLADPEWDEPQLKPVSPVSWSRLRRAVPVRHFERPEGPCLVLKRPVEVGLDAYWERFERVAVEHLLAVIEREGDSDLDDVFVTAALPDRPPADEPISGADVGGGR
jgi:ATP-dependent Clp protease ATP-binding subunit ClpC